MKRNVCLHGSVVRLHLLATVLLLATAPVIEITGTTATCGGAVTSDGGAAVTARGVCWSTSGYPTTADSKTSDGSGTGAFDSYITGLTPGTRYHVCAYATNSVGTSCGIDAPLTTGKAEINLKNGGDIPRGGDYDFGIKPLGTHADVAFTIENAGTADLIIMTPLTLGGADTDQFSIQVQPTSPVAADGSTTFTISFSPTSPGTKTVTIAIGNADADENPYEFAIQGAGDRPEGSSGGGGNNAPVPNAGPDQTAEVGERALLDSSASYDPDEGIQPNAILRAASPQYAHQRHENLKFQWAIAVLFLAAGRPILAVPEGADIHATMQNFDSAIGSFIPNVPGIHQFDLFVTDDYGDTVSDRVAITVFDGSSTQEPAEEAFRLERVVVWPNPFDAQVRFGFIGEGVPEILAVTVYDLAGRRMWEGQAASADSICWDGHRSDGRPVAAGPYIYAIILFADGHIYAGRGLVFSHHQE